jgi:hypothetical protein
LKENKKCNKQILDALAYPDNRNRIANRVTKLGKFWAVEKLFSLRSFSKITEAAQVFGQLFSTEKVMH